MGVRTTIRIKETNQLLEDTKLIFKSLDKTIDGISDSTYLGTLSNGDKCILKIYEFASSEEVINEIRILNTLKDLPTPKPLINDTEVKSYKEKPVAVFSYLNGKSYDNPSLDQVKEIGLFLGKFHAFSKSLQSVNKNIYTQEEIKIFIKNIKNTKEVDDNIKQKFLDKYELVESLNLEENCVIHGDLFPDNAKFEDDKLSGVFDFVEACNGNFFFDLAVVINSWCFDGDNLNLDKLNIIISEYNNNAPMKTTITTIKQYMLYASLFYACQRFNTKFIEQRDVEVKDYNEYLVKFNKVLKIEVDKNLTKCIIDLIKNIKEQINECVKKSEIGLSPSGSKSYNCKYNCIKILHTSESKRNIFIKKIVTKLEHIKKSDETLENCEIEISISLNQTKNMTQ